MTRQEKNHSYLDNFQNFLFVQRVAPKTMEAYLRSVTELSSFHKQSAEGLTNHQIQDFLLYNIREKELAWSSCNVLFCGLKKYYVEFLGRSEGEFSIPPRPRSKQLSMLLSREEVNRLLNAKNNLKHRALLTTVYGSGLRVSEAVRLKPRHIESDRMEIRVEQGKGHKDRYTVLSQNCLNLLRTYYRSCQPEKWLFFGRDKDRPMSIGTGQSIYYQAKKKAGITKGRGIHTLRHSFASHALESGVELYIIKRWLGHTSIKTTCKYIHLSPDYCKKVKSPLDVLYENGDES
jgi:site-specific recombinase XerD